MDIPLIQVVICMSDLHEHSEIKSDYVAMIVNRSWERFNILNIWRTDADKSCNES